MDKKAYLNAGCGNKFHPAWTNIDMKSLSPHVREHNLLRSFPFQDGTFEVVYHSQVLEHFPRDRALFFVSECFRVLRPGGTLRVVVPDLEEIVREYLGRLEQVTTMPSARNQADYDWIMLELYDQTVRNEGGGDMARFLQQPELINERYVVDRIGFVGKTIIADARRARAGNAAHGGAVGQLKQMARRAVEGVQSLLMSDARRIGAFRLAGEIHMWMYDRFSLSRLLAQAGFTEIRRVTPHTSSIADWSLYELDVRDGQVYDPTSLFMEATRP